MAENTTPTVLAGNTQGIPAGTTIVVQKRSSVGMMIAFVMIAILGGGGAAWFVSQQRNDAAGGKADKITGQVVHLEGFTVNLADPQETNFVRVTMDLELDRMPAPADRDKPVSGLPVARIRDTIIAVLAASKAESLLSVDGKIQLKKSLLDELNRRVPEIGVREIYFTEFLVQR